MKHPSTLLPGDAKPLTLLDADVEEMKAKALAAAALSKYSTFRRPVRRVRGQREGHPLRALPDLVRAVSLSSEAAPTGNDLFYIGISAVDGTPITAEHPSKLRAGTARLKRIFTGD